MRKTKIIATIGPASEKIETIKKMMAAGLNVARLNFSHGTHDEHRQRILNLRQAAEESQGLLAIMLDTSGPEIRTGRLADGVVKLEVGQRFVLTSRDVPGNHEEVQVSYANLPQEVTPGTSI